MRALLAASLAALLLAGTALADPLDPKVAYNRADQASARAAVLVASVLGPGWAGGVSATPSSLKAPICPSLRPDYSKMTLTGHAESSFANGNGGVNVISDVEVWKTLKQAEQHMGALLQPALPKCLKYSFLKTPGGSKLILFPVKATKLGKFADVSVSYRETIGVPSGGKVQSVISDFVLLRKGRTELYLNVTAPSTAVDQLTAFETRIAKALVARVRA